MPRRSPSRSPSPYRSSERSKRRRLRSPPSHHDKDDKRRSSRRESISDDDRKRSSRRSRDRDNSDDGRREKKDRDKRPDRDSKRRADTDDRSHRKKDKKDKRHKHDKEPSSRENDEDLPVSDSGPSLLALGYSNVDNPFNDVNIESKFVWSKKQHRDKKLGLSPAEVNRRERERRLDTQSEIEKLEKRRAEREIEMALREEELARMQRESEVAMMGDWQAKEDEFHLEQAKRRAEIRIKEGRAKPIDILAMNMRLANEAEMLEESDVELEIDLDEPYTIFDNLVLEEVDELHKDIQMYLTLEKNEENLEFWRAMIVVSEDKLSQMRSDAARNTAGAVSEPINDNIVRLLSGKTYEQLKILESKIRHKLSNESGEPIDVEYWEHLLKAMVVYQARAKLADMHQTMLTKRLEQLRRKQREQAARVQGELEALLDMHGGEVVGRGVEEGEGLPVEEEMGEEGEEEEPAEPVEEEEEETEVYERGMSPEPVSRIAREDREITVVDALEDFKQLVRIKPFLSGIIRLPYWLVIDFGSAHTLRYLLILLLLKCFQIEKRRQVLNNKIIPIKKARPVTEPVAEEMDSVAASVLFEREAARGLDEDEAVFNVEAAIAKQTYMWQDKYRPRKPRYFNRVHTGYEWNKYNQTHYDSDNPPPKVVQGYKFNIFYPDLLDKSKAPTYVIEREPDTTETVFIRFKAGPPYEDIAFRIVNREWEYSHKKGFRSSFDRGVLQLYFHFKRHYYRK
ncbi:mid region of cactin-domain-containing protein [Jimgerdemannia flammicorona]|uniref:Splicing factor Cactin n=1 Tax=Jimgerdemannia flammicorona TaxID=994334 RepID=A0A433DH13_9FUNG|nr:mid region of cactin-domain-containing protein [Jimgerdemannia flammicorona]